LTSGGQAAAEAATLKINERYQFADNDLNSDIIDIVPRMKNQDEKAPLTEEVARDPAAIRQRRKFSSTDSDESEPWVEMSARDISSSTGSFASQVES
jgi:hypothetical protein